MGGQDREVDIMGDISTVIGLVTEDEAEATVDDLQTHGLRAEDIEVFQPRPGDYRLADQLLHEEAAGAARTALAGAAIGLLVGLVAGVALAESAGVILLITIGIGAFGALIGGMVGLAAHDQLDDDPTRFRTIEPGTHERLIEVHDEHWRNRARRILERHGAEILQADQPVTD